MRISLSQRQLFFNFFLYVILLNMDFPIDLLEHDILIFPWKYVEYVFDKFQCYLEMVGISFTPTLPLVIYV